jgi:AcrR family transcriptional regulator
VKVSRAQPLAPEERRKAIVLAITPLLRQGGATVTTKQMADAAGIAEGTIFRVFPDKNSLLCEAIRHNLDPTPFVEAISQIDPQSTLPAKLVLAGRILLDRMAEVMSMSELFKHLDPDDKIRALPTLVMESQAAVTSALTALFEPHRHMLVIEPSRAALAFRGMLLAVGHPLVAAGGELTLDDVVSILLEGIANPVSSVT